MPTIDTGGQAIRHLEVGAGDAFVLFADDLHAASAYEGEVARLAGLVPDCGVVLAGASGHRHGEDHPLPWTDPGTVWGVAAAFLGR